MNIISQTIIENISNPCVYFVFSSEITASLWARKSIEITTQRSVALNRFLAWDSFKESVINADVQGKKPVSAIIRRLFANKLIKKNAETVAKFNKTGTDSGYFFTSLIPPEFAKDGNLFAGWIAGILPSLGLWKTQKNNTVYKLDEEDYDYMFIQTEYEKFLEEHTLFEPGWETPPVKDKQNHYYIFFPEAFDDYNEYKHILSKEQTIHLVSIQQQKQKAPPTLYRYDSICSEIRSTAHAIRQLHKQEGIAYEDIAISLPDLEEVEPYLLREFSLHNIPVRYRSGKPLGEYSVGRLFSLINDCVRNNFAFSSVKALVLNEHLPWRYPELNEQLIEFGIKNNCVSGYREGKRFIDVWEQAFRTAYKEQRLAAYYKKLKKELRSLVSSKNFSEIRNRYFIFRGPEWITNPQMETTNPQGFLSREKCSDEGDAVIARCIEELSTLILMEKEYPNLIPPSPFSFYLSILKDKQYVLQQRESGINIFPYCVAAAAPFRCHFILNTAQNSATVLYQPLHFLRQDKRAKLKITDTDASETFFRMYQMYTDELAQYNEQSYTNTDNSQKKMYVRFSCSDHTFSGWNIPHSHFLNNTQYVDNIPSNFYIEEKKWWAHTSNNIKSPFPQKLFSIQKQGFSHWEHLLNTTTKQKFNILYDSFPQTHYVTDTLEKHIEQIQKVTLENTEKSLLKVSASDLKEFFFCPTFWLYNKIGKVQDFSLEAQLLDDMSLGNLYHEILKNIFTKMKQEDGVFVPEKLQTYFEWVRECTEQAAYEYPAFQGPLAQPLIATHADEITEKLCTLLETESDWFSGYTVGHLEETIGVQREDLYLNGKLDRISYNADGDAIIIDYKTGTTPTKKECTETDTFMLTDFQIPMYIKLYEESVQKLVAGAFFISIHKHELTSIIGEAAGRKRNGHTREEYQQTLDAFESYIKKFSTAINQYNFSPPEDMNIENCLTCEYKNICRTTFSLNSKKGKTHVV